MQRRQIALIYTLNCIKLYIKWGTPIARVVIVRCSVFQVVARASVDLGQASSPEVSDVQWQWFYQVNFK